MAFSSVTVQFSKNGDPPRSQWRQDLTPGNTITCSLSSTVGVTTFRWRLIGRPEGSAAGGPGPEPIALGNSSSAAFTADVGGTYIVECLLNGGAPDATILTGGCAILASITAPGGLPLRLLGPFETDEDNSDPTVDQGQDKMLNRWLRLLAAGGAGGGGTLAVDYNLGTAAADQTLTITDLNGGGLILDAETGTFTGTFALQVLVGGGTEGNLGGGFLKTGGMELGPDNILIGHPGYPATGTGVFGTAIGGDSVCNDDGVALGFFAQAQGLVSVALGYNANAAGNYSIAVLEATASGSGTIAAGVMTTAAGALDCVLGNGSYTDGVGGANFLLAIYGSIHGISAGHNIAIGYGSVINPGDYNILLGTSGLSGCGACVVEGQSNSVTTAVNAHVIGTDNTVTGADDVCILGNYTIVDSTSFALAIGDSHTFAAGAAYFSSAIGYNNSFASGSGGHSFGDYNSLMGGTCLAWGDGIVITGTGTNLGIGIGVDVTVTSNQCVIGNSDPIHPEYAIHELIVRGYNAAAIDTLNVTDAPANDYQTGLTIPYNTGVEGAVVAEPVYAQTLADLPVGALVLYFPGTS